MVEHADTLSLKALRELVTGLVERADRADARLEKLEAENQRLADENDQLGVTTRKWRICPTFKNVSGTQVGLTVDVVAFSALRAS